MNNEHLEQTAVLQNEVAGLKRELQEVHDDMATLRDEVRELIKQLTKYKGFIGGIFFTLSCIVTALGLWFSWKR